MPVPLSRTNGLVSGTLKPLFDMGRGGSSVNRITLSSTERDPTGSEFNAGVVVVVVVAVVVVVVVIVCGYAEGSS